ncbi:N-acetyltransferase [Duganella sp. BJB488]|uniref:GNAT family N-acetyltransferase n=1 Tax=unclassified Duganella TaxID=2636909 RepID=UPI000E340D09|nr:MULTISPECIES: GNAT family N-acetyltransferase [unclassified Duganella]RFP20265.1 N-acetyltransferase [Duganella sp. BJB489]RFP21289.1 N-acetyltransferase [Duganella sp. BJB488]RFP33655.1 N-acetyltransferase [Duganella sp. BJB480]
MNLNLALIERWLTGRSLARGLSLPSSHSGGLCVEVGSANELRRHVFVDAGPALKACAAQIHAPRIFLKAAVAPDIMRAALPERWTIEGPGYLMYGSAATPGTAALAPDYHVSVDAEHGGHIARVIHASGELAASGRIAVHAGSAVFDQIITEEAHRRLGLGSVVMQHLDAVAEKACVTERLLVATEAGRALYERLGWTVLASWSTAVLVD